ncbi:hypothetical protein ACFV9E_43925 [Streptomyces sp. NPDC059835]|uniref:hypothetical protein n=1 Tax=Streptomyces sp. NPDC059835 TaxID=3346967 RepID=UPI00366743F1
MKTTRGTFRIFRRAVPTSRASGTGVPPCGRPRPCAHWGPAEVEAQLGFAPQPLLARLYREVSHRPAQDTPPGPISVIGDFNHRHPAAQPLQPHGDGSRTARVSLPTHSTHSFRYLAAGDHWFDAEQADHHDGTNNRVHT